MCPATALLALLITGCATTEPSRADLLVIDLNRSSSKNMAARVELKELGHEAVPSLLKQIDHSASYLRVEANALAAMRAMRVLREINTSSVLPVCRRVLNEEYLAPTSKYDCALLNEALETLYDQFTSAEARDIFYEFISGGPSRYTRKIRHARHWDTSIYTPRVQVDVVRGLRLLASKKDDRAAAAMASFITSTDIGSLRRTYYHRLAENGFVITEAATGGTVGEMRTVTKE